MLNIIKLRIKKELELKLKDVYKQELTVVVEEPKKAELGDISIPIFSVVKTVRRPLPEVLESVKKALESVTDFDIFESVSSVSGFINITLNKVK